MESTQAIFFYNLLLTSSTWKDLKKGRLKDIKWLCQMCFVTPEIALCTQFTIGMLTNWIWLMVEILMFELGNFLAGYELNSKIKNVIFCVWVWIRLKFKFEFDSVCYIWKLDQWFELPRWLSKLICIKTMNILKLMVVSSWTTS